MIRYTLLTIFVLFVGVYSWRDWFKGACAIIVLMAVIERPDMPKLMFGIPGFNPLNFLLFNATAAWLVERVAAGRMFSFDRAVRPFWVLYMALVGVSFLRLVMDQGGLEDLLLGAREVYDTAALWREFFLNTYKWLIPGFLIYDGCRTEERQRWVVYSLLAALLLLAIQVVRNMPLSRFVSGEHLTRDSLKMSRLLGYHRVDVSMLLAGAFWSFVVAFGHARTWRIQACLALGLPVTLVGMLLTGGRAGYLAWIVLGMFFGSVRWRKMLLLLFCVPLLVMVFVPGVYERVATGISDGNEGAEAVSVNEDLGEDRLGAGRLLIWPIVLEQIGKGPLVGFGRMAMVREGVTRRVLEQTSEPILHPHNAYLEWLLDTGVVGMFVVLVFYGKVLRRSYWLFMHAPSSTGQMVGGVALALIVSYLIAGLTAQSFYPRESTLFMWSGLFLALRVHRQLRSESAVKTHVDTVQSQLAHG